RFQSLLQVIGIIGCTFRSHCVASFEPIPKLKLFWKGTLMRLAIGFWLSLASSSVVLESLSDSAAFALKSEKISKITTKMGGTGVSQATFPDVFSIGFLFHQKGSG